MLSTTSYRELVGRTVSTQIIIPLLIT